MKTWRRIALLIVSFSMLNGPMLAEPVNDPCDIKVSFTVKSEINDEWNGQISLTLDQGKAPFSYLWSSHNFSSTQKDLTGLKAGFYTVIIRDAGGCVNVFDNIQVQASKK